MKNDITRREALVLGASAAALAATGASAQSAIKAANVPAPKLEIEKGFGTGLRAQLDRKKTKTSRPEGRRRQPRGSDNAKRTSKSTSGALPIGRLPRSSAPWSVASRRPSGRKARP